AKIEAPVPELDNKQTAWQSKWHEKLSAGWTVLTPASVKSTSTNAPEFKILDDRSVLVEGTNPQSDVHEVSVKLDAGTLAALRLDVLPHESLPKKSAARADDGRFRLSEFEAELIRPSKDGTNSNPKQIKLAQALAEAAEEKFEVAKSR